jgi:hypothetical protein
MSRSKGRIIQDYLSVINNNGTVRQRRMSEVTGFGIQKFHFNSVKEILWDHECVSDVTGCGKTQVLDGTSSTQ